MAILLHSCDAITDPATGAQWLVASSSIIQIVSQKLQWETTDRYSRIYFDVPYSNFQAAQPLTFDVILVEPLLGALYVEIIDAAWNVATIEISNLVVGTNHVSVPMPEGTSVNFQSIQRLRFHIDNGFQNPFITLTLDNVELLGDIPVVFGSLECTAVLDSQEVAASVEIVEAGITRTTPFTETLPTGSYTLIATFDQYSDTKTVQILEDTVSLVTFNLSIPTPYPSPQIGIYPSETRGVLLHMWHYRSPDIPTIVDNLHQNGINTLVIEVYIHCLYVPTWATLIRQYITEAIFECHKRNMQVIAMPTVCLNVYEGDGGDRAAIDQNSTRTNWMCTTKSASRSIMKEVVETLAGLGVDGIMYDYIRIRTAGAEDMCFCDQCHTKFLADTGLTDTVWPSDVLEGGRYRWEFLDWRKTPVTELVRDMSTWARAVNPSIAISAAVFPAFSGLPMAPTGNYVPMDKAQHTADWIAKDYLNYVVVMGYTDKLYGNEGQSDFNQCAQIFFTGARTETNFDNNTTRPPNNLGMVPLLRYVSNYHPATITPSTFASEISNLRANGANGFIIWRYGGPGLPGDDLKDITPYLQAIPTYPEFRISNINWVIEGNALVISWNTSVPATSRVEYNPNSPLFEGVVRYGEPWGRNIHYVDVNYLGGEAVEDQTLTTAHQIIIPLSQAYFRIISEANGVSNTSLVFDSTALPPPPPLPKYVLTIASAGNGSTDTGNPPGTYSITEGDTITVTAIPASGYTFDHWELNGQNFVDSPLSLLSEPAIDGQTLTAYFRLLPPDTWGLTVTVSPPDTGTTNPNGSIEINEGETVIVEAFPSNGYRFSHWELNEIDIGSENPITIPAQPIGTSSVLVAVFSPTPIIPDWLIPVSLIGATAVILYLIV